MHCMNGWMANCNCLQYKYTPLTKRFNSQQHDTHTHLLKSQQVHRVYKHPPPHTLSLNFSLSLTRSFSLSLSQTQKQLARALLPSYSSSRSSWSLLTFSPPPPPTSSSSPAPPHLRTAIPRGDGCPPSGAPTPGAQRRLVGSVHGQGGVCFWRSLLSPTGRCSRPGPGAPRADGEADELRSNGTVFGGMLLDFRRHPRASRSAHPGHAGQR